MVGEPRRSKITAVCPVNGSNANEPDTMQELGSSPPYCQVAVWLLDQKLAGMEA